jgi:hypothetical protein
MRQFIELALGAAGGMLLPETAPKIGMTDKASFAAPQ